MVLGSRECLCIADAAVYFGVSKKTLQNAVASNPDRFVKKDGRIMVPLNYKAPLAHEAERLYFECLDLYETDWRMAKEIAKWEHSNCQKTIERYYNYLKYFKFARLAQAKNIIEALKYLKASTLLSYAS